MDMHTLYRSVHERWAHHGPIAVLHLGDDVMALACGRSDQAEVVLTFSLGLRQLVAEVLTHTPPTPLQLELAIETVEEQVMPAHTALPPDAALVTQDAGLWHWAQAMGWCVDVDQELSLATLEEGFNLLVAHAQGRPASVACVPSDPRFAATLVVLRELMHHLHFKRITLLAPA